MFTDFEVKKEIPVLRQHRCDRSWLGSQSVGQAADPIQSKQLLGGGSVMQQVILAVGNGTNG